MRIVHYLALVYCLLLASIESVIYFSSLPKNDLERFAKDVQGVLDPNPISHLPLILGACAALLFLAWIFVLGRKKEGLKKGLLALTLLLSIVVLWTESPFFK
ncbi:hypothetical protein SAMN05216474_0161 [Lishizhenia tianjinensis]|uniref:Uncharacterized protein n=1 Tax=Lishizhenia tianjinensis TaxID=477690 RepID=A0A1I6XFX8_9FLAO|nr:hypothetical protein [Lishizhenia tianjinensis]SFT37037.1 hypothetical protein SAMN05216474_0161 [Lishizhenia tianjinensis]